MNVCKHYILTYLMQPFIVSDQIVIGLKYILNQKLSRPYLWIIIPMRSESFESQFQFNRILRIDHQRLWYETFVIVVYVSHATPAYCVICWTFSANFSCVTRKRRYDVSSDTCLSRDRKKPIEFEKRSIQLLKHFSFEKIGWELQITFFIYNFDQPID